MRNLIRNELHKLFAQKKMFVFFTILLCMALLITGIVYTTHHNPKLQALADMEQTANFTGQQFPLTNLSGMVQMFSIFAIIMIAEMITEEYTTGTLKLSLLHPVTRRRLITAKAASLWIATLILLLFTMVFSYIIGTVFFGWGSHFVLLEKTYSTGAGLLMTLGAYLLTSLPVMAISLVVLYAALFLNSSGAVIGLGLGFFFAQSIISQVSSKLAPFMVLTYTDIWGFLYSEQWRKVGYGLLVFLIYGGISYILSLRKFRQKDLLH